MPGDVGSLQRAGLGGCLQARRLSRLSLAGRGKWGRGHGASGGAGGSDNPKQKIM